MTDTTLIPSPSLRDAAEQKLTKIKPGCWRNKWLVLRAIRTGTQLLQPGEEYLSDYAWPSREVAEEQAQKSLREEAKLMAKGKAKAIKYLGAFFFPNEEGGAS